MCIFCSIINNEIPSKKIYEDEDFLAILDLSQATFGHTIVMTKKHYNTLLETPDSLLEKYLVVVKKISNLIKDKLGCEGINILNNTNPLAGQTIMHTHIHIIPRYTKTDVTFDFTDHQGEISLDQVFEKIMK